MATKEYELGSIDGIPEVRINWRGIQNRSTHHHAYVSIDADISDEAWGAVKECAMYAGGGAILASIFTAGAGAFPGFWATFSGCIAARGIEISNDRVHLRTETHHGSWG
jgi:hypothetical protein